MLLVPVDRNTGRVRSGCCAVVELVLARCKKNRGQELPSFTGSNPWASASVKIDRPQRCEWVSGSRFCTLLYINFTIYPGAAGSELVLLVLRLPLDGTSA